MEYLEYKFPILRKICEKWQGENAFEDNILFAVQPIYKDSMALLKSLRNAGLNIDMVLGLSYSSDHEVVKALIEKGIPCKIVDTENIEQEVYHGLENALNKCVKENKTLLILENGGYATPIFHHNFPDYFHLCKGAVEETKQGLWRLLKINNLGYPVFQVADTPIKKIESEHIGEAVVNAISLILKEKGIGLQGKRVGVLGFGWIGSSVTQYLKQRNTVICCFDIDPIKMLEAYYFGFANLTREEILRTSDIIIGSTGKTSLDKEDFFNLKQDVFLVSASSKKIEFNLIALEELSIKKMHINKYITTYTLPDNNKRVHLIYNGEPVNFSIKSLPNELMDIMMADMFNCLALHSSKCFSPGIMHAPMEDEMEIAEIALQTKRFKA